MKLGAPLKKLADAHLDGLQCEMDALGKMELCLSTLLRTMGHNLAQMLDLMRQVTVSAKLLLVYADVGLHMTSQHIDQLRIAIQSKHSSVLPMASVVELVKLGMKDYDAAYDYPVTPAARTGFVWLADTIVTHFLKDAVQTARARGQTRITDMDILNSWILQFVAAQGIK